MYGSPIGSGDYVVNEAGTAVAADDIGLTLYRGEYDIYLVSYNSQDFYPTANGAKNLIEVSNGKDFMYSNLKGISVQPTSAGENMMSVTLPEPFTRLCSNVVIKVQANRTQPVSVSTLAVSSVNITKLSCNLSYQMGKRSGTMVKLFHKQVLPDWVRQTSLMATMIMYKPVVKIQHL